MDDALLVQAFRRTGDEAHFKALVERHQRPTFRLILSILGAGHHEAAEDLTQDVFLKVYRRLGQFRGEAKFSTWLYRIAYNQAVDYRARAHFRVSHDGQEVLDMTPTDSPRDDPFATMSEGRTASVVKECLAELPHLYRSVIHQHYWMGMTIAEIGKTISAPEGTVKSYMHRARATLHKLLAAKGISHV
jgi:RNA polymerase sigma-70 factor (ECF subfamily)